MIVPTKFATTTVLLSESQAPELYVSMTGWATIGAISVKLFWTARQRNLPLPWTFYSLWVTQGFFNNYNNKKWYPPLCLYVQLTRSQPHFTFLKWGTWVTNTYSFGTILRLYLLKTKHLRRNTKQAALAFSFFAKYFSKTFRTHYTELAVLGYARCYNILLATAVARFSSMYIKKLFFLPQTLSRLFLYRRVKGIKKRIRKRLKRLDK